MDVLSATGRALRILVVSNVFAPQHVGGAEVVALRHAKRLVERGHDVEILGGWLHDPEEDQPASGYHDGLLVHRVPFSGWDPGIDFHVPATARRLAELLRERPVDIVHFHNLRGLGVNLIAEAKRHGARTVVTLHDNWGHCLWATRLRPDGTFCAAPEECAIACAPSVTLPDGTALPQRLRRDAIAYALEGADQLISPSLALAEFYAEAGFRRDSIRVVSNGIDLSHFQQAEPPSDGRLRFSFIASLAPHKGLPALLRAATLLHQDEALRGRWVLDIVGKGELRGKAEEWVASHGLEECVRVLGPLSREAIPAQLRKSAAVVLPSLWPENEPLVMLEAMASGIAQIASGSGGNKELVEEGRSGFLVPPGDAEAIARAMAALIVAPDLAARQGAYNWARREHFDEARSIDSLLAVYEDILGREAPARRPVVYCAGEAVAETSATALSHAFHFEGTGNGLRFLWKDWAEREDEAGSVLRWDLGADVVTGDAFAEGGQGSGAAFRAVVVVAQGAGSAARVEAPRAGG